MRLLKTVMVLVVVMGLILGSTMPALAAPGNGKPPWAGAKMDIVKGEVTAVGTDNIMVQTREGEVTIFVERGSKFRLPSRGKSAVLDDIQVGMQVVALVYERDGALYARHIAVIPGIPQYRHRVGEVVAYTEGVSITIQPRKGDPVTFTIDPAKFKILPPGATVEVGKWVTVISRRLPASDELVAMGVVVHPVKPSLAPEQFRERLRERLRWMEMERLRLWELERTTGIIADIDETNTTLTLDQTVLDYNEGTIMVLKGVFGLETGQSATVFYQEREDGTLLAKLILVKVEPPEMEETGEAE